VLKKGSEDTKRGMTEPQISVAVVTRNRASRLVELFRSLAAQTLDPSRFEVIVVDDASTDATASVLRELQASGELNIEVIRGTGVGLGTARNASWRAASAPMVAFIDDDCEATPDWLERVLEVALEHPGEIVQGPTTPNPRELGKVGPFTRTKEITGPGPSFQTCNIAYPRNALQALGGFDETIRDQGEDTDLGWRAREAGIARQWSEAALVHHAVEDLGPVGFLRTALRGADAPRVFDRHPDLRGELLWGVFRTRRTLWLVVSLVAMPLARRVGPVGLLLTAPYARHLADACARQRAPLLLAPYYALWDLLAACAALQSSVRHRTLIL
jgi:GT2 family glycosyltransferase